MNSHLLKLSNHLSELGFAKEASQVVKIAQVLELDYIKDELRKKRISIDKDLETPINRYIKFIGMVKSVEGKLKENKPVNEGERIEAATAESLARKIKEKHPAHQNIFDAIDAIYNEKNTPQQPIPPAERPRERTTRDDHSELLNKINSIINNNNKLIMAFYRLPRPNARVVNVPRSNGSVEKGIITSFNPETRKCQVNFGRNLELYKELILGDLIQLNRGSRLINDLLNIPQPELIELPSGSKILLTGMSWVPPVAQYAVWNEEVIGKINKGDFQIIFSTDPADRNNEIITKIKSL
jgi:hypothetical protein